MILKDGTKHACRSCITGHRSSKCVHHDRELFPIAKKGRPSTQCKACKQRGTPGGRCECQLKRKSKGKADDTLPNGYLHGTSYQAEGSSSRQDSSGSQISSFPAFDDASYSRMVGFPSNGMDGHSTRATNSSASSPSYAQQSFAISHAPLDHHAPASGLPFPQADAHFAYSVHPDVQGREHAGQLQLPPPRSIDSANGSRPHTAGEEDVPWWLYRAGYSPNARLPYEPPPGSLPPVHGTPGGYSDYNHYLANPSPYLLGTPGAPAAQASPAFVWHNNATSYRDYMATQQVANYHTASNASQSDQAVPGQEQQGSHPGLAHHHSLPYMHASTSTETQSSAPHSAPVPLSSNTSQTVQARQRGSHDSSWASMSMESSNSGHYTASSNAQEHRIGSGYPGQHPRQKVSRTEEVPGLTYESGYAAPHPAAERHYESKPQQAYSNHQMPEASLRERRSTSFDQIASRASPINLRLPEERKKRKLEADV